MKKEKKHEFFEAACKYLRARQAYDAASRAVGIDTAEAWATLDPDDPGDMEKLIEADRKAMVKHNLIDASDNHSAAVSALLQAGIDYLDVPELREFLRPENRARVIPYRKEIADRLLIIARHLKDEGQLVGRLEILRKQYGGAL